MMPSYEYETTTTRLASAQGVNCALAEDLLPLYIEGEVSQTTRDLMVEHLAQCEHCAGFLAGAQSARLQLRRDNAARAHVIARDQPAQQAIAGWQVLVRTLFELSIMGLALLISGAMWTEIQQPLQTISMMLAILSFLVLSALVHRSGSLTILRLLKVGVVCILGSVGAVSILMAGEPPVQFFGALFVIVSIAGLKYLLADALGPYQVPAHQVRGGDHEWSR
jgi:hypothetical protein